MPGMTPEAVHGLAVKHGLTHEKAIIATAIAWAESELNPEAVGDENLADDKWGPSVGLYQVRSLRSDAGTGKERDIERLKDPSFNTRSAVAISNAGTNWQPWSVWKNGSYRKHLDAVRAAVDTPGGSTVVQVRGGKVRAHVQAFADACSAATGADNFGTYNGHSPSIDRALDIFHRVGDDKLPDAICGFAIENLDRYGVDYIISLQRIYNPEVAMRWRPMADRGNPTQNHFDHVHISFEPTGGTDKPKPKPDIQGDLAMLTFRYIYDGQDWVFDGPSKLFFQLNDVRQITEVLDKLGVKAVGQVSDVTHSRYSEIAASAGFSG